MQREGLTHHLQYFDFAEFYSSQAGLDRILAISKVQDDKREGQGSRLRDLSYLVIGRESRASDLRDKVYAMISLRPSTQDPDYRLGVVEVYCDVARTICENNLVNMLCCVQHPTNISGLPSWVPDWSQCRRSSTLGYEAPTDVTYSTPEDMPIQPTYSISEGTLSMAGCISGHIIRVSEIAGSDLTDAFDTSSMTHRFLFSAISLALDQAETLCTAIESSQARADLFTNFWETLIGGRDHELQGTDAHHPYARIFAMVLDTVRGRTPTFHGQPADNEMRLSPRDLSAPIYAQDWRKMQISFKAALEARKLAICTERDCLVLIPDSASVGDCIILLQGAWIPFVGRKLATGDWLLIGECYVHGLKVADAMRDQDLEKFDFV